MKCKSCKTELPSIPELISFTYCPYCGKALKKQKNEVKVPEPRKLKSGKWNIELRKEGYSITEDTYEKCKAKAQAIRAGFIKEEAKAPSKLTIGNAIDNYIDSHTTFSPETIRGYKNIRRNRFKVIMDKPVNSVTNEMMQSAINIEASSFSPKTVFSAYSLICTATGKKYDVILPKKKKVEKAYLDASEIKIFCERIKGSDIEIPALLGLSSMRKSEILGLTWSDVNLKDRYLTIRNVQVIDSEGNTVIKDVAKNETSNRIVPIMMNQLYDTLNAVPDKSGKVCTITGAVLYKAINKICVDNNLPKIGIHGLRHSFASLAASSDVNLPISTTMAIGGWKTDNTLKAVYTHTYQTDIKNSQNAIANFYNTEKKEKSKKRKKDDV